MCKNKVQFQDGYSMACETQDHAGHEGARRQQAAEWNNPNR